MKKFLISFGLLILFIRVSLFALPENIRFNHLTIDEGLSQNTIACIAQDDRGFIWIGTQAGLNKYDGYNFTVYKTDIYDSNSLSENHILSICKDDRGFLWVGTEHGLNKYDPSGDTFTRYYHDSKDLGSISNNIINTICKSDENDIWIGTTKGLNRYDQETNAFVRYSSLLSNQDSILSNDIRSVIQDKSGTVWIGSYGGGLTVFNSKTGQVDFYHKDHENSHALSDNYILALYEDRSGVIWVGTEKGGLNRFDRDQNRFTCYKKIPGNQYSLNCNQVNVIHEDKSGRLWIGTQTGGLSNLDRETEKFFSYKNDPDNPNSLSGNAIISLFEDNTGSIWAGNNDYGINVYNQESNKFVHYHHEQTNRNSLNDNMIWGMLEDKFGILWIGTDRGGLNKFDRIRNTFTHYVHDDDNPNSISSNLVTIVYEDHLGELWIGTNGGLDKLDRTTGQFTHYTFDPGNPHSISNNKIRSIYEDRSGILWIGTRGGGLNRFDRKTERFVHYKHDPNDSTSISNDKVYCLYEDYSNNFWVGTFGGGLDKLERETGKFIHFKPDARNPKSLSGTHVAAIHEDSSGYLWIGTLGGGLNKFDWGKKNFTHFTEKDGLPNNEVYAMLEDGKGNLWMSTIRGLSKFNKKSETFTTYSVEDGLQSNEFNLFSACKSRRGEMFFGGINGFNTFFPDYLKENPFPPSVVITGFKLTNVSVPVGPMADGRTILDKLISETSEITLSYRDKVISFEFAALHYAAPKKNLYAYKMEGLEDEWNFVGSSRRFVTYSGLSPGKYVFRVKASNNDGLWNENGTSLQLTIIPPFWKTWWYYTVCIICTIVLIAAIIAYVVKQLENKRQEKERLRVINDIGQVLEHGSATIYRRGVDSKNYDYMGKGIRDITGYESEDYNLPVWYSIVQTVELIGEHSGMTMDEAYKHMLEGRLNSFVMDFCVRTKSGDLRWARDITTALRDESGRCTAFLGIIFDITDRKLAEQGLAETSDELLRKNEEIESDLNMAREVQVTFLKKQPSRFPEKVPEDRSTLQFCHRYLPATTLAGDFFNIIPISDHSVGILICDVMGHGARASLLTAYLQGLIEQLMPDAETPGVFMRKLNIGLNAIMYQFAQGIFATAFYLVADIKTGQVFYTNAGHPRPLVLRRSQDTIEDLHMDGKEAEPALGLFKDFNYSVYTSSVKEDDLILLYTDGVYDVDNKDGEMFGLQRLFSSVENRISTQPDQLLDGILQEMYAFTNRKSFRDDVCLIAMHVGQNVYVM